MNNVVDWIVKHDNKAVFTWGYIILALVLSIFISMFWLVALVGLHALFENISLKKQGVEKYRYLHVFWHIKLDVVLVLFALWLGIYLETIFGLLGLSAAVRTGAQAGSRMLAWKNAIRTTLLTADEAALVAKSLIKKKETQSEDNEEEDHNHDENPLMGKWSTGEKIIVISMIGLLGSMMLAPFIIDMTYADVLAQLMNDLHPWPMD